MRMLLYLSMLLIGVMIGYKEIAHKKILDGLDKFQMAALFLLLFVMGVRIGSDKEVMDSIQIIGFKAIVYAVITIAFSIAFVWIYEKKVVKRGKKL